jgi:hypothetical protein
MSTLGSPEIALCKGIFCKIYQRQLTPYKLRCRGKFAPGRYPTQIRNPKPIIAPFVFVVSLFKNNLNIYEVRNNGAWYNFGYLFGLACFFGGGGNRAARRKQDPKVSA